MIAIRQLLSWHENPAARFWSRVNKDAAGCWLWTGARASNGYGNLYFQGEYTRPHRLAWQLTNGPIPAGQFVCHTCDVRLCCNPDHLFLGTNAENARDMVAKGRSLSGPRHPHASLTLDQVRRIRALTTPHRTLARQLGISERTVRDIRSGRRWASHV